MPPHDTTHGTRPYESSSVPPQHHSATSHPNAFVKQCPSSEAKETEIADLMLLRDALRSSGAWQYVKVPDIVNESASGDGKSFSMTYIHSGHGNTAGSRDLGTGLAKLHRMPSQLGEGRFGLNRNNRIGLTMQSNAWVDNWGEFFIDYRLLPMIRKLEDVAARTEFLDVVESHRESIVTFLSDPKLGAPDHPAIVHGDLWSGNAIIDNFAQAWLIDPAVYIGDREVDLAMTEMFGGYNQAFYEAYDAGYPRSRHYRIKRDLYNGYHYLNHVILFGSGYMSGCHAMLTAIREIAALVAQRRPYSGSRRDSVQHEEGEAAPAPHDAMPAAV